METIAMATDTDNPIYSPMRRPLDRSTIEAWTAISMRHSALHALAGSYEGPSS